VKKERIAIFPGSFDPITIGHEDIILRALPLFDKIIVAIGENSEKKFLFSLEKRLEWIRKTFENYDNVTVDVFSCLTVDYCEKKGAKYIIRGLRNEMDFAYEKNIFEINKAINSDIETIFLISNLKQDFVSSSFVREMMLYKKDIRPYLPNNINLEQNTYE